LKLKIKEAKIRQLEAKKILRMQRIEASQANEPVDKLSVAKKKKGNLLIVEEVGFVNRNYLVPQKLREAN
jgi:hypothetical protein